MEADWRPVQGSNPPDGSSDWRAQIQPEARSRIVNKIMETLKKHMPLSEQEGLDVFQRTAVLLEEKIYSVATNQADYLRKLSLKMLSMETEIHQDPGITQVMIPNQNRFASSHAHEN